MTGAAVKASMTERTCQNFNEVKGLSYLVYIMEPFLMFDGHIKIAAELSQFTVYEFEDDVWVSCELLQNKVGW